MIIFLTHQQFYITPLLSYPSLCQFLYPTFHFTLLVLSVCFHRSLFLSNFLYMNLLSFMGTSDCGLFFSDKDSNSMEFNSISKPTSEFQEKTHTHDDHQLQEQEGEREVKGEISVSCLKIKTPSLGEFKDEVEEEEGCRTPTCLDQIIPLVPQCPPAPRKPKKMLLMKRKAASRRTLLDLSSEVEALFPPSLLVNLGGKIKKVRIENSTK